MTMPETEALRWKMLKNSIIATMNEPQYTIEDSTKFQRILNQMDLLEDSDMLELEMQKLKRENQLWLTRWNTLKNYLGEQYAADDQDDCCYGTIAKTQNAMEVIEGMNGDAKI